MKCRKWERWLSDELDGALSPKRAVRLELHVRGCARCRDYRDDLSRLHGGTRGLADPAMTPGDWSDFSRRLESRLAAVSLKRPRENAPSLLRSKPAWALAGALLLIAAGTYLAFFRPRGQGEQALFSLEDPAGQVISEIGLNPDLENSFNREIVASINESAGVLADHPAPRLADEETPVSFGDNPMFWEGLSEDELGYIEFELRKERGLGGWT